MVEIDDKGLLQDIEKVFETRSYPGDDNLVYDNSDTYWGVVQTKRDFLGKDWRELSIETINYHRDDLPFFTPEAFCFYLPALLKASISYPIDLIDVLPENLIYRLAPPSAAEAPAPWFSAVVEMLTMQQRRGVMRFLEWFRSKYVPEELMFCYPELERALGFWKDTIQRE